MGVFLPPGQRASLLITCDCRHSGADIGKFGDLRRSPRIQNSEYFCKRYLWVEQTALAGQIRPRVVPTGVSACVRFQTIDG